MSTAAVGPARPRAYATRPAKKAGPLEVMEAGARSSRPDVRPAASPDPKSDAHMQPTKVATGARPACWRPPPLQASPPAAVSASAPSSSRSRACGSALTASSGGMAKAAASKDREPGRVAARRA